MTRGGSHTYKPAESSEWKDFAIVRILREKVHLEGYPLEEPVSLHVTAVLDRPKRLMRKKDTSDRMPAATKGTGSKPDEDNILKLVQDTLVVAGVMRDDTFVVDGRCTKWYRALDEGPHVFIDLRTLEE